MEEEYPSATSSATLSLVAAPRLSRNAATKSARSSGGKASASWITCSRGVIAKAPLISSSAFIFPRLALRVESIPAISGSRCCWARLCESVGNHVHQRPCCGILSIMANVQLDDAVAAAISAQAAALGLTVQAYLQTFLMSPRARPAPRLTVDELDRLLDEEALIGPSPSGSFSRAELYCDHD